MGQSALDSDMEAVQNSLVKVMGIIVCPILKILRVYSTGQIEIHNITAMGGMC